MEIKGLGKGNLSKFVDAHINKANNKDKPVSFTDKLQQVEDKVWRDKLDLLLEKIQGQGKILAKTRSLKELKKYKKMIKSFMQETVGSSLALKQNSSRNKWGKYRLLMIVEQVDESLRELTELMLSDEEKTLDILDKLDEIRGLLVDLYT